MGIVNATPDSFSDGGQFLDPRSAVRRAETLLEDGADMVDVGAESTRPGAAPVSSEEEWQRLEPILLSVLTAIPSHLISVDTYKPEIMLRCADLGVGMINDIAGGRYLIHEDIDRLQAYGQLSYLAMHMHGLPQTMQKSPLLKDNVVVTVRKFFAETTARLCQAGFSSQRIWLDPGFGFGKTDAANWQLMEEMKAFAQGYQIAVGISRKGWIGRLLNISEPSLRDDASKMLELGLVLNGARLIRTHKVKPLHKIRLLKANFEQLVE